MRTIKQLLITVAVLLCSVVASAHDFEVDGIYYNITDATEKTVEVTYRGNNSSAYLDEYSGAVNIPSSVNHKDNTYCVTTIGNFAFDACRSLTSITIPNTVTTIGNNAFNNCSSLTSLTIPNSVTTIGWLAFYECASLTSVTIGNNVTTIGDIAFYGCSSLTSLTIPNSVTSIGYSAFNGCRNLEYVTIGNGLTNIKEQVFSGCTNLKNVTIGNNITAIENRAFSECKSLESITFPSNVTSIGEDAFRGCSKLTSINIPKNVTNISNKAFNNCNNLENIVVESGNIVYDSRENCNAIIETITNTLISGCNNSTIPASITSIGNYAFYNCSSLTSITIPNSVTSIGTNAFRGCSSLKSIYLLGETPPSVGGINNFTESQYINIILYVPVGALETYQDAYPWKEFQNIQEFDVTGINDVNASSVAIEVTVNGISLSNAEGAKVDVYTLNGVLVRKIENYKGEEIILYKGVYLVRVNSDTIKIKL